jgi:hypothetical protein
LKKAVSVILTVIFLSALSVFAAMAAGGAVDDPLISLSYLKTTVTDKLVKLAAARSDESLGKVSKAANGRLDNFSLPPAGYTYAPKFTSLDFDEGGKLTLGEFGCFILFGGEGRLYISSGEVINISTGEACKNGDILTLNNKYFAAENTSAYIRLYTNDSWGMVDGYYTREISGTVPLRESFLDVAEGYWAADYIYGLAEAGIVKGVGGYKFAPSANVTRGAFVTIVGRICNVDMTAYTETGFSDTDIAKWYGPYVAWAGVNGIVTGDSGSFYPDNVLTREQMAVIIVRLADYLGLKYEAADAEPYTDSGSISSWASDAVVKARSLGIMTGKENNTFDPKGTATRAEICAVARRLMDISGKN